MNKLKKIFIYILTLLGFLTLGVITTSCDISLQTNYKNNQNNSNNNDGNNNQNQDQDQTNNLNNHKIDTSKIKIFKYNDDNIKNESILSKNIVIINHINSRGAYEINKYYKIRLSGISDGDTVWDTLGTKFRFKGTDTPEKGYYENQEYHLTTGVQYNYAIRAKSFVEKLIQSNNNEIIFKRTDDHKTYERLIGMFFVKIDGIYMNLSSLVIRNGYGRPAYINSIYGHKYYYKNKHYINNNQILNQQAKAEELGIYAPEADLNQIYPPK